MARAARPARTHPHTGTAPRGRPRPGDRASPHRPTARARASPALARRPRRSTAPPPAPAPSPTPRTPAAARAGAPARRGARRRPPSSHLSDELEPAVAGDVPDDPAVLLDLGAKPIGLVEVSARARHRALLGERAHLGRCLL